MNVVQSVSNTSMNYECNHIGYWLWQFWEGMCTSIYFSVVSQSPATWQHTNSWKITGSYEKVFSLKKQFTCNKISSLKNIS